MLFYMAFVCISCTVRLERNNHTTLHCVELMKTVGKFHTVTHSYQVASYKHNIHIVHTNPNHRPKHYMIVM